MIIKRYALYTCKLISDVTQALIMHLAFDIVVIFIEYRRVYEKC